MPIVASLGNKVTSMLPRLAIAIISINNLRECSSDMYCTKLFVDFDLVVKDVAISLPFEAVGVVLNEVSSSLAEMDAKYSVAAFHATLYTC